MANITTTIPSISDYPKLGDTHAVFRQKADIAWKDLANLIPKINEWSPQVNDVRDEVSAMRDDTERFLGYTANHMKATENLKNETANLREETKNLKDAAVIAADRAESVIVPTEATYSYEQIDTMIKKASRFGKQSYFGLKLI